MEAGRELDALVAEKVMGLIVPEWGEETPCPYCGSEMRYCGTRSRCSTCQEWRHGRYKEYSTDIAAAWGVVEKMIAEFPAPEYQFGVSWVSAEDGWSAGMGHFQHGESYSDEWYSVFGETAPHAICLAALKAKGVELD